MSKRQKLYHRQDGLCFYCDRPLPEGMRSTLDHVIPGSRGGANAMANLVLCCQECNWIKANFIKKEEVLEWSWRVIQMIDRIEKAGKGKLKKDQTLKPLKNLHVCD